MLKYIILFCGMFLFANVSAQAFELVPLTCQKVNKDKDRPSNPKSPDVIPSLYIDEYTLSYGSELEGFELQILDEDGVVVYSTIISAGTSQVVLPSTLSGDYEIRFVTDDYYYYGYITL